MDHTVLKKRLNTFKSGTGRIKRVSDDVVIELLRAWENWPGSAADLYREVGLSKMQMVTLIQKAKRLISSGTVTESEFHQIKTEADPLPSPVSSAGIELLLAPDKVIRFSQVEQLIDFLKKVA